MYSGTVATLFLYIEYFMIKSYSKGLNSCNFDLPFLKLNLKLNVLIPDMKYDGPLNKNSIPLLSRIFMIKAYRKCLTLWNFFFLFFL